jgi:hypothetical protein
LYICNELKNQKVMSTIIATNEGGGERQRQLVPAGNHIARCYKMVHIGTVTENVLGEDKTMNKVRLEFELPLEKAVFSEEKGEEPFSIGQDFTLSMHEKATLRKTLEAWRGKPFTEAEAKSFDITKLLGQPCMVNVVHGKTKAGKDFAKIAGITPVPKGFNVPEQVNKTFVFGYSPFEQTKFEQLPKWLQEKVMSSQEWAKREDVGVSGSQVSSAPIGDDDDLPF